MSNRAPSANRNETWRLRAIMLPAGLVRAILDWARPDTPADRLGTEGMCEPVSVSMIDAALADMQEQNEQLDSGELDVLISELQDVREDPTEYLAARRGGAREYDHGEYDFADPEMDT